MRMGVPSERPTIPPSFNVAKFAKDSDRRIAASTSAETQPQDLQSEVRLVTRPRIETVTHETWARAMTGALYVRLEVSALKRLPLDHRAGFLLSLMDGTLDLETVVEVSGMPRDEVLRTVRDLFDSGVVDQR
jgi:hypothetical protein